MSSKTSKKQVTKTAPFGFERPSDSPGFLLWQTTALWQKGIKAILKESNLSHAQFVLMALTLWLTENEFLVSQALLTEWSMLDKMTVSKSLTLLELAKLVKRVESKKDPRAKEIILSKDGQKLLNKLVPKIENFDKDFFEKLNQQNFCSELLKLLKNYTKQL